MKALTVRQPYAWAILYAGKNIENRSWTTKYRGPLLIHAGASFNQNPLPHRLPAPKPDDYFRKAILGEVELIDIVESSRSRWYEEGSFAWLLADPRPFSTPILCKGHLGLWDLSPAEEQAVRRRRRDMK